MGMFHLNKTSIGQSVNYILSVIFSIAMKSHIKLQKATLD